MKIKHLAKIIFLLLVIVYTNNTFAINKGAINLEQKPKVYNTNRNIEQAKFIEIEVVLFKKKLLLLQNKYLLKKDALIINSLKDIQEIIYILRKIQTAKVNKSTADYVIKVVIKDLKNINSITKTHLRKIKSKTLAQRLKYNILALKLSRNLDNIVNGLTYYYAQKSIISKKGKNILLELRVLQKSSKQLKNFNTIQFKNISETKNSLIRILKAVKKSILRIKRISRQK